MKEHSTVTSIKTETRIRAEAIAMIDELQQKGLDNKMIVVMLQSIFRQRSLDRILNPSLVNQIRALLHVISKFGEVDDFWIAGLRDTLTRPQAFRFDDLADIPPIEAEKEEA